MFLSARRSAPSDIYPDSDAESTPPSSYTPSIAQSRPKRSREHYEKHRLTSDAPEDVERRRRSEAKTMAKTLVNKATFEADRDKELGVLEDVEEVDVTVVPGTRMENELLEDLMELTRENMKSLYDGSGSESWAWSDLRKRGELRNDRMRWVIVRSKDENEPGVPMRISKEKGILGFMAFRFSCEVNIPHTYLHELQIGEKFRAKGLGQTLMKILERISREAAMRLILLTVFTANKSAFEFYQKLGYQVDEASPGLCYNLEIGSAGHSSPYEIMSMVLDPIVNRFKCERCENTCRFEDTLQQHGGFVHQDPWPHPCLVAGCGSGTVHLYQLQLHMQFKHAAPVAAAAHPVIVIAAAAASSAASATASCTPDDEKEEEKNLVYARIAFKSDGRKGTVVKGDKGFYTVRLDGPMYETVTVRAAAFVGYESQPMKKKEIDPDYAFALMLQYEDGFIRKSSRRAKN